MIEMFVALMMVPSPGSRIGLSSSQMTRPVGSSMTDHSDGKAVMWLPRKGGNLLLRQGGQHAAPPLLPLAARCVLDVVDVRRVVLHPGVPVLGLGSACDGLLERLERGGQLVAAKHLLHARN